MNEQIILDGPKSYLLNWVRWTKRCLQMRY